MLACAFVFGLPLAIYPFAGFLQADSHHQTAAALMNLLREKDQEFPPSEKRRFLRMASDRLNETLRKHPTNDRARLLLGETHLFEGIYHIRESASRGASVSTDGPNPAAVLALEKAVDELNASLTSLRYHQSYYLLGLAYRTLALHVRDEPRHGRYLKACRDSFESAVYFGPNYTPALFELSELLEEVEQPLDEYYRNRITQLRRAIRESAYFDFDRYFVFPTNKLLADQNYWQTAREVDEKLLAVAPMEPDYLRLGIEAHMLAGNHSRVLELVERTRRHPDHYAIFYTSLGGAYSAIIKKDWALLLEELTHYGMHGLRRRAELAAFETHARKQLRLGDIPSQFPPPAGIALEEWEWILAEENAFLQYRLLGDAESGRRAFEHRLELGAPAPDIEFWIEYAYLALAERDEPLVRECLGEIRSRRPDHPVLRWLENALKEFAQAAPR